jgi:hypothetical protein
MITTHTNVNLVLSNVALVKLNTSVPPVVEKEFSHQPVTVQNTCGKTTQIPNVKNVIQNVMDVTLPMIVKNVTVTELMPQLVIVHMLLDSGIMVMLFVQIATVNVIPVM